MAIERKNAPYAPPSNVIAVIRRFRERNLPEEIDLRLLTDIGISKGNVHRTHAALEFLGLINSDGTPTSAFHSIQIATDEEYTSIFEGLVRAAYREVFQVVDPGKDSQTIIDNHFRRYQPTSQRSRMVTLFLALCREAGIPTLDMPRERAIRSGGSTKPSFRQAQTRQRESAGGTNAESTRSIGPAIAVTVPSVADLRRSYIAALIEQVRQSAARGVEVSPELLERIERLMAQEESDIQNVDSASGLTGP